MSGIVESATRAKARGSAARVCLVLVAVWLIGARPQCDVRTPGNPCQMDDVIVEPGDCVELDDPCGKDWADLLTLSFDGDPGGFWFEVERRATGTHVRICAADTVALTRGDPATVRIVDSSGHLHSTTFDLATVSPLVCTITADPETVTALDTLRLTAHPSGGVQPYEYEWLVPCTEGDPVGDNTTQSILAYADCEDFWLFLRDSFGQGMVVQTEVPMYARVTVTATPSTIDPGGSTRLFGQLRGDVMETWWVPTTGLANPEFNVTTARPTQTTLYTLHARTKRGLESSGSVLVTVRDGGAR